MLQLPVDSKIDEIHQKLKSHNCLILISPPGSGKTTRVPPSLVNIFPKKIILLQPRKVAVRSCVRRIADERNWEISKEIGYQVRFENCVSNETQLIVATEGVLSRKIQMDSLLSEFSCVILDEFHERNLHTDLALAWIRFLQKELRPDLKLIVMSATINGKEISDYLENSSTIECPGKLYPLEIIYRQRALNIHDRKEMENALLSAIEQAFQWEEYGDRDILVFLPGVGEIRSLQKRILNKYIEVDVLPLHSRLNVEEQEYALRASNRRKIILTTNIAETSLTVPGVGLVIDSGLEKNMSFDPEIGVSSLSIERVSLASADQRAGRAAREAPGACLRLWTQADEQRMKDFLEPEIKRKDFLPMSFLVKSLPIEFQDFQYWLTPPPMSFVESAEKTMKLLRVIDKEGNINFWGRAISHFSANPREAVIVLHGQLIGELKSASYLSALISERDICREVIQDYHFDQSECDLLYRLDLIENISQGSNIDSLAVEQVRKTSQSLMKQAKSIEEKFPREELREFLQKYFPNYLSLSKKKPSLNQLILLAYPDRLTLRRLDSKGKMTSRGKMFGGRGVQLSPQSCVQQGHLFLSLNPTNIASRRSFGRSRESQVSLASMVKREWLENYFPDFLTLKRWVEENKKERQVWEATSFINLPIERPKRIVLNENEKKQWRIDQMMNSWPYFLKQSFLLDNWFGRLNLAKKHFPDLEWVEIGEEEVREVLELMEGEGKILTEASGEDFVEFFSLLLSSVHLNLLEKQLPEVWTFPMKNRRPIFYNQDEPILSVRLQELFGYCETPRIISQQCGIRLELLAPNFKTVQITSDLKSFWENTYPEVRKDLRLKYSRHFWPENPMTAAPEFKGGYPAELSVKRIYSY